LFDEHESSYFKQNAFYGRPDFMELARRFEIPERRIESILNSFATTADEVTQLVQRSFLSHEGKQDYLNRFMARLQITV
jgi:serine/threonine-protein kinase HipA